MPVKYYVATIRHVKRTVPQNPIRSVEPFIHRDWQNCESLIRRQRPTREAGRNVIHEQAMPHKRTTYNSSVNPIFQPKRNFKRVCKQRELIASIYNGQCVFQSISAKVGGVEPQQESL